MQDPCSKFIFKLKNFNEGFFCVNTVRVTATFQEKIVASPVTHFKPISEDRNIYEYVTPTTVHSAIPPLLSCLPPLTVRAQFEFEHA